MFLLVCAGPSTPLIGGAEIPLGGCRTVAVLRWKLFPVSPSSDSVSGSVWCYPLTIWWWRRFAGGGVARPACNSDDASFELVCVVSVGTLAVGQSMWGGVEGVVSCS